MPMLQWEPSSRNQHVYLLITLYGPIIALTL